MPKLDQENLSPQREISEENNTVDDFEADQDEETDLPVQNNGMHSPTVIVPVDETQESRSTTNENEELGRGKRKKTLNKKFFSGDFINCMTENGNK